MIFYKKDGWSLFGYLTVDGETITTYGWEEEAGGGNRTYNYVIDGETVYSVVEPTPIGIEIGDESSRQRELMGYDMLTIHVDCAVVTDFPVGCYCVYQGTKYTMAKRPKFVRNHSRSISYTLLMYSDDYAVRVTAFKNTEDGRVSFPLTATPKEHLQMVVDSLNAVLPSGETAWSVGNCIDWDGTTDTGTEKLISYDYGYCIDALQLICETFETEYYFNGRAINLGKLELNKTNPLEMSYGRGNGFLSGVGCEVDTDTPPLERVYVQGGEQNIDPSTYGSKTLLLPSGGGIWYDGEQFYEVGYSNIPSSARRYAVSSDRRSVSRYGSSPSVDGFFDGAEIYPSRVGEVSSVVVVDAETNLYDIVDSSIPSTLDYEDCLIAGETMTIIFQSGMLAGREFDVKYYHSASGSSAARRFEIVPAELDGVMMPGGSFVPAVGDKYAVFHCQLPSAYFDDGALGGAEWDLLRPAVKHLYDHEDTTYTFSGEVDGLWSKNDWANIGTYMAIGQHIQFTDDNVPNGVLLRVTAVKEMLNNPYKPQLTLSNALVETELGSTLKRYRRREPGSFDPRERWERERLWGRTNRGLSARVETELYNEQRTTLVNKVNEYHDSLTGVQSQLRTFQSTFNTLRNALVDRNGKVNGVTINGIGIGQCSVVTVDERTYENCTYAQISIDIPDDL